MQENTPRAENGAFYWQMRNLWRIVLPMERRVERIHLDRWINNNGPDGLLRLADRSRVSSSTINKVRRGYVPRKQTTREKLAEALGMTEHDLFPSAISRRNRAS